MSCRQKVKSRNVMRRRRSSRVYDTMGSNFYGSEFNFFIFTISRDIFAALLCNAEISLDIVSLFQE